MSIDVNDKICLVWDWDSTTQKCHSFKLIHIATKDVQCHLNDCHEQWVDVAIILRDRRLLTGSKDKTLRLWDLSKGSCVATLIGHEDSIDGAIELANDDIVSWSSTQDRTYRVWDKNGRQKHVLNLQGDDDWEHHFKPELNRLITWQRRTGRIGIWDLQTGKLYFEKHHETYSGFQKLFGSYGSYFITNDRSNESIKLWDSETGEEKGQLRGKIDGVCAYSPVLTFAWYFDYRSTIEFSLIDMEIGVYERSVDFVGADVANVRVLNDGKILVWLNDFRLIVLNNQLQVLAVLPQPTVASAEGEVIGKFSWEFSDAELAAFINKPPTNSVSYYNANGNGNFLQTHNIDFQSIDAGCVDCFRAAHPLPNGSTLLQCCEGGFYLLADGENALEEVHDWSRINFDTIELWENEYLSTSAIIAKASEKESSYISQRYLVYKGKRMRLTQDKTVLSWNVSDPQSLAISEIVGQKLRAKTPVLDLEAGEQLEIEHPIISPDGSLFNYVSGQIKPLLNPKTKVVLKVNPETRFCNVHSYWADNNQIALWYQDDLLIFDADARQVVKTIKSPFDYSYLKKGITLVNKQRWLAWSGLEFASWDATTLEPLYRLQDPVDDSPHYHQYWPLKTGGIAYAGGQYSCDRRIVLWDGAETLRVIHCHPEEIGGLIQINESAFLSWTVERDTSMMRWSFK